MVGLGIAKTNGSAISAAAARRTTRMLTGAGRPFAADYNMRVRPEPIRTSSRPAWC